MTKNEVIDQLKSLLEHCKTMRESGEVWVRDCEALDIAIAALRGPTREQVERVRGEWKECFEDWRMQIAGDQCSRCGFQHYGTSINYYKFCPTCGAPMTDEAVDIVMKRLEALKDETKAD